MIEKTSDLLMQLHAAKQNKKQFDRIVSENLTPYNFPYELEGAEILGLFRPKRGKPVVVCLDRGSLVAVNQEDFEE